MQRSGKFTIRLRRGGLLLVLSICCALQGCANSYAKVVRQHREAGVCCMSIADLPTDRLQPGDTINFRLDARSPAFRFTTGMSYFRAFTLPRDLYPYKISVSSYLVGDYLTSAYLFFPQVITLDEHHQIVRSTGPGTFRISRTGFMEALKTGGDFRYKLEGDLVFTGQNREERYLVVLTTEELLRGKSPIPDDEVPMMIAGGSAASSHPKEVEVPHAPAGSVRISLAALDSGKTGAGQAPAASPADKSSGVAGKGTGPSQHASPHVSASTGPETIVVHLPNGKPFGTVELGRTTLDAARALFENHSAGLGPERSSGATFAIGAVSLTPRHLFSPPGTAYQLYFDENGVLVIFADGAAAEFPASGKEFRRRHPTAAETWRSVGSYELQADVGSCVTLVGVFRTVNDSLDSAAFGFGCPTQ